MAVTGALHGAERAVQEPADPPVAVLGTSFDMVLLEMPLSPIACTSSSTVRVDTRQGNG